MEPEIIVLSTINHVWQNKCHMISLVWHLEWLISQRLKLEPQFPESVESKEDGEMGRGGPMGTPFLLGEKTSAVLLSS